ncbi:MAG: A/G-specific adenine glycosylase [Steroidobacteraceae bacterium]
MLQQTQVTTVSAYYQRFMARFPDVRALADAPLDEVLHLWSGLGYYARARNLHRAAVRIRDEFAGELPQEFALVAALPGIGRSTAGAILALSHGMRFPILDGNVRRVLSRYFAVATPQGERATLERLWDLSEACTPRTHLAEYTQAIMDLGATVCVRRAPRCAACPLSGACVARQTGRQHELPASRKRAARATRRAVVVVAVNSEGEVLLERRPVSGIWGGLWSLPQFDTDGAARNYISESLPLSRSEPRTLGTVQHGFTHFNLLMHPVLVRCAGAAAAMEAGSTLWYNLKAPPRVGLPAPIRSLLQRVTEESHMSRMVQCVLLKKEAPGLDRAPYPGDLGRRIYEGVSREAWAGWLKHQTMLINEYRLTPIEPKARKFLETEMEKFFFGAGSQAPQGYQAPPTA